MFQWLIALLPLVLSSGIVSATTVHVQVVPYLDSDAWAQSHVTALKGFLQWCQQNDVKVAVFHYDSCEDNAPGITNVIKQYARQGVITLVGLHTVSHALGGLPPSLQYWEIEFNQRFLKDKIGYNVGRILSIPYWVFDSNTLHVCHKLKVKIIICGVDYAEINPHYASVNPTLSKLSTIARHMLPGYFNVNGDKIYYFPAVSFVYDLLQTARNNNITVKNLLRNAVIQLINTGMINTNDKDTNLILWILIHPWELAKVDDNTQKTYSVEFEKFLQDIKNGNYDFKCNNTIVRFELSNPKEIINKVLSGNVSNVPMIKLLEPNYVNILDSEGFKNWLELFVNINNLEKRKIILEWRDVILKWWHIDSMLWTLTINNAIDKTTLNELYQTVKLVWDEAGLNSVLKSWDLSDAEGVLNREEMLLNDLYFKIKTSYDQFLRSKLDDLLHELNVINKEIQGLNTKLQELKNEVSNLKNKSIQSLFDEKELQNMVNNLKDKIQKLKLKFNDLGQKLMNLEIQKNDLSEKLNIIGREVRGLSSDINNIDNEIQSLKKEIENASKRGSRDGRGFPVIPFVVIPRRRRGC